MGLPGALRGAFRSANTSGYSGLALSILCILLSSAFEVQSLPPIHAYYSRRDYGNNSNILSE